MNNKNEIINNLKKQCTKLYDKYNKKGDKSKIKLYSTISNILNSENAFDKIDAEVALNILLDLGMSQKNAYKVYNDILNG